MCTVTLIPTRGNDFILTSNRDEAIDRKTFPPDFYKEQETKMLFPKDALAGGTWIGVSERDTMICLLNGGFENHEKLAAYRKSRGVVVKDFLASTTIVSTLKFYDFKGVEPCTIIIVNWTNRLIMYELVWDGKQKHLRALENKPYIWSSSTLYTNAMKRQREQWFADFKQNIIPTEETLLNFHKHSGIGDTDVDLQIDRGLLKTRSITQVSKENHHLEMRYENLQNQEVFKTTFESMTV